MELFEIYIATSMSVVVGLMFVALCYYRITRWGCEDTDDSSSVRIDSTSANRTEGTANQQEDIFNISSRVQGQGQWPTHDAHVSLDHFAITNEINKYNDDPPTYEEAMNIAASNNNNTVVPAVVPKTTITPSSTTTTTTTTSTSTSAAN
ncbi:uncharacterized protein LOC135134590 isoform X9 [Zophobas morio]|uniref:uncharacterized protein LOC135134590 isoform X9 n=1 Tax=Zophobas morio TaxID=2755281 RepID=UPI00308327A4